VVSTAAQGGGTPSYYLDSVSGGACLILYFYLGGLKEGMKKRILVLFVLFCVIFTEYSFAENNENNPIVEDEIVSGGSNVEEVLPPENQEIKDEKKEIKLNADKTTIVVTKTFTLKLINTTKNPVWSTSNKKVATVDKNGKVTGIKAGTVTITATNQLQQLIKMEK